MLTDIEWQDIQRRHLIINNIYLPDSERWRYDGAVEPLDAASDVQIDSETTRALAKESDQAEAPGASQVQATTSLDIMLGRGN
jgi:hypothetical protein